MSATVECCFSVMDLIELDSQQTEIEPELRTIEAGEVAWDSANADGKIIVVKEGLLRVYHGANPRRRLAGLVGPRRWLGAEVLAGEPGEARAIAATPTVVALVDASRVVEMATNHPQCGAMLIKHLSKQFCSLQQEVTESRYFDCTSQVIQVLLRMADCAGETQNHEGRITLAITQQDVADAVGIARETVNSILQKLAESKLIQKQRGRITLDAAALRRQSAHAGGDQCRPQHVG